MDAMGRYAIQFFYFVRGVSRTQGVAAVWPRLARGERTGMQSNALLMGAKLINCETRV